MIFHSANNLKRKKKEKKREKEKRKRKRKEKKEKEKEKKKKKKRRKRKRGHKRIETKAPCNNSNLAIPFKHGQVLFKFNVDRVVNDLAKQFNLSQMCLG
jgi:hypothetical protein